MTELNEHRILVVEDNEADVLMLRESLATEGDRYEFIQVETLEEARKQVQSEEFALVLLDLGLPDSQGAQTFLTLHKEAPTVPFLVLTGRDDPELALEAVRAGAQDYFIKRDVVPKMLPQLVRFAIARHEAASRLEETRRREEHEREIEGVAQLAAEPSTSFTSRIFSAAPLRECVPDEFDDMLTAYGELMQAAVEQRIYKLGDSNPAALQAFADRLGFLRAGPRDLVEIHMTTLRNRIQGANSKKAAVEIKEGRLLLLGLMGELVTYYRRYYPNAPARGKP